MFIGNYNNVSFVNHTLKVTSEGNDEYNTKNPLYLACAFKLVCVDNKWEIREYTDLSSGYILDKNYKINFTAAPKWFEPTVINDKQGFLEMERLGQYILNTDLTFESYFRLIEVY